MFSHESLAIGVTIGLLAVIVLASFYCLRAYLENARCGHSTLLCNRVTVEKDRGITSEIRIILRDVDDEPQWCLECLATMTAACALCPHPIVVGDHVGLYTPAGEDDTFHIPPNVATFGSQPLQLVCHEDCCEPKSPSGYWVPGKNGVGQFYPVHPNHTLARLQKIGWQVAQNDGSHRLPKSDRREGRSVAA